MVRHIELIGLPGSGKTTVRDRLSTTSDTNLLSAPTAYKIALCKLICSGKFCCLCQYVPKSVMDKIQLIYNRLVTESGAERYSEFYSVANNIIMRHTQNEDRRRTATKWLQKLLREYDTISRAFLPPKTVIFDEGFLQRSLSFFCPPHPSTSPNTNHIQSYVDTMPHPDLVITLKVSTQTSYERMHSRSSGVPSSYSDLSRDQLNQSIERMDSYIEQVSTVVQSANIPLISVENEGSLERTLQYIRQELSKMEKQ